MPPYCLYTGLARTIHIGCRYSVFAGNSPNRYTVICGVYIQFWPTLLVQQKIASCRFVSMVFIYHGKALTECFIHDALCCASILQITATTIAQKPMHMHMLFLPVLNGCCRTVTAVHRHCCAPSLLCSKLYAHGKGCLDNASPPFAGQAFPTPRTKPPLPQPHSTFLGLDISVEKLESSYTPAKKAG